MATRTNRRGLLLVVLALPLWYVSAAIIWPLETHRATATVKYGVRDAWAWTFEHVTGWPYKAPRALRAFAERNHVGTCLEVETPRVASPRMRPARGEIEGRAVVLDPGTRGVVTATRRYRMFAPLIQESAPETITLTSGPYVGETVRTGRGWWEACKPDPARLLARRDPG